MDPKTLQQFEILLNKALGNVATKNDLKGFVTKSDLKSMEKRVGKRFDDVNKHFDEVDNRFEGIKQRFDEVDKRFDGVDQQLIKLDEMQMAIFAIVDNRKAEKVALKNLEKRVSIIETELHI